MKKLLYVLSLTMIGGGIIASLLGHSFIGLLSAGCGVALALITFVSGKLIDASQQATFDNGSESLEMKINNQISESRRNKFKAESEIRRLTSWTNDAIFTAYSAAAQKEGILLEKDKLFEKYDSIHEQLGAKLEFEAEDKCDNLVKDYKAKIDGYKERIEVFDQKQDEYMKLKEKIKAVKQKEKMMKKLEGHDNHMEQANEREISSIAAGDYDLSQLTMSDLEKEVFEREEYYRQVEETKFLEKL
ncbi:MAG: hypothetical protein IKR94_10580 [Bacteroidales bacterium]|nr:hypothetical protein [Bacteroidales bacterium]MBR4215753.1 hypothetical protein [Bacteroidales bacterium]